VSIVQSARSTLIPGVKTGASVAPRYQTPYHEPFCPTPISAVIHNCLLV